MPMYVELRSRLPIPSPSTLPPSYVSRPKHVDHFIGNSKEAVNVAVLNLLSSHKRQSPISFVHAAFVARSADISAP